MHVKKNTIFVTMQTVTVHLECVNQSYA